MRKKIQVKEIKTPYMKSEDQLADVFTKDWIQENFKNILSS
jgi:hypothetical protein